MPCLDPVSQNLWGEAPWDELYVIPDRTGHVVAEHQAIVAAINDGDAVKAGQAMQAHLEAGMTMLIEYMANQKR
mgnify:CR=1 FL=1